MLKLHTYDIIRSAVLQVKALSQERGFPLHGALWADWGVGKTVACKQVVRDFSDVFYLRFPNRSVDSANLVKLVLLSLGVGPTRGFLQNYDILTKVLSARGLLNPVLLIDEAQFLLSKPSAMSFFKDLSEDPDVGFSYIFLGDTSLENLLNAEGHSLIKRIRLRSRIPSISEETINKLARFHGVSLNGKAYEIAVSTGATTMDVDFALYLAKKASKEKLTDKEFKEFLIIAKRGE
jgi:hypothetical protein